MSDSTRPGKARPGPARPTWGVLLIQTLIPLGALAVGLGLLTLFAPTGQPNDTAALWYRIGGGAVVTAAVLLVIWLLRRATPNAATPTPVPQRLGGFALGVLAWLLPAAVMLSLPIFGSVSLGDVADPGDSVIAFALLLVAVLLSEAIPEEAVFRGQVLGSLLGRLRVWPAIVIQALLFVLFALALRGWMGWLDLSLFLTMGIVLGYLRVQTGSIWFGVGFHLAFQVGSQAILTHGLVVFSDAGALIYVALGAAPFTVAVIVGSISRKEPLS